MPGSEDSQPELPEAGVQKAIGILTQHKPLRVWSFIVTLFGDLARGKGEALSGSDLSNLTSRVGIKPASTRVALHRLRKDGWIDSRRDGRAGWYFLTEHGRAETLSFSHRVYAPSVKQLDLWDKNWQLFIGPSTSPPIPDGENLFALPGHQNVFLGTGTTQDFAGYLSVTGQIGDVPEWLLTSVAGPALRKDYEEFEDRLAQTEACLPPEIPALDRAVLRGQIVHGWRRLLLRHPDLPDGFFGPQCRIAPCRSRVIALLALLGQVTPADLAQRSE